MMRNTVVMLPVDSWTVILLAARITYKYLGIWVRMMLWSFVFSIPLISIPLVAVSVYRLIEMVITADDASKIRIRDELLRGALLRPGRDLSLLLVDVVAFCVIVASMVFWWTQTPLTLRAMTGVSLSFLVLWWVAQVVILPLAAIAPTSSVRANLTQLGLMLLGGMRLLIPIAFVCTMTIAVSVLLLGPLLLISIPFVAICGLLCYFLSSGMDQREWKALQASTDRF